MLDIAFVFALPFILYGIALGFYHLGRILTVLAVACWHRMRRR